MALLKLPDISGDREFALERNIPQGAHVFAIAAKHLVGHSKAAGFYYKRKIYSKQRV